MIVISRRLLATALAASFVAAQGCRYYSNTPDPGTTDADIKRMMEPDKSAGPPKPVVVESTAEEMLDLLTDPMAAATAQRDFAKFRRLLTGKVVERSPDGSESPHAILDGGTHQGQAYKVKCIFTADQRDEIKSLRVGETVQIEGTSDGVIKEGTVEVTDCDLKGADDESDFVAPEGQQKQ